MKRNFNFIFVIAVTICFFAACSSIEKLNDPFIGDWASGVFNLEFKDDKTFELSIGKTISVNLEGKYKYDDELLTLDIEGDSKLEFSYKFKDDKNMLVLKPEGDSSYIKTKIEFERQ